MKEGWEAKRLVNICKIQYGYPFDSKQFCDDSKYPQLIRIRDVSRGYSETYYSGEIPEGYYIDKGDYLIGMDGEFNIAAWNSERALLNQRVCKITANEEAFDRFLYYNLRIILKQIEDETPFVTVKHLSAKRLNAVTINLPPLSEQQHIVEELDLLTSIIERKKVQLMELDNLAQSLFYEMFGNPFTNEKEWEVKIIGDCFSYIKNGANIKQTKGASGYPITRIETLSNGVFNRDRLGYANICDLTKYTNYVLNDGDLLMSHINSKAYIGRTVMYKKEDEEQIIHGMNLLRLVVVYDLLIPTFADYYFKTEYFKDEVAKIRKDAVNQSSMAIGDLRMIRIFLPPLALQQQFASNIEAIERQKKLIKQSIKEVETLFNSRMDYYFN